MGDTKQTISYGIHGQQVIENLEKSLERVVKQHEQLTKVILEHNKKGAVNKLVVEKQADAYTKETVALKGLKDSWKVLNETRRTTIDVQKRLNEIEKEQAAQRKLNAKNLRLVIQEENDRNKRIQQFEKEQSAIMARQKTEKEKAANKHREFVNAITEGNKKLQISFAALARIVGVQILYRIFNQFTRLLGESMQTFLQFSIRIGEIQTISQQSGISTAQWTDEVRKLSDAFGSPLLDVAEAHYQAISNQIVKGAESLSFMREAQELAIVSVSSFSDAVAASSSILNAFNYHVSQSEHINAVLFKTVELGRIRLTEMANSMGRTSKLSNTLGIMFEEQQAALASLTIQGMQANVSITLLNNVMLKLIKPTTKMKEIFDEWGVSSGQAAIKTFGFFEVLRKLEVAAKEGGDELKEIGEQFGRLRAITGRTALDSEKLNETLAKFETAAEDMAKANDIMLQTIGKRWEITINKIKNYFTVDLAQKIWSTLQKWAGGIEQIYPFIVKTVNITISLGKALVYYMIILKSAQAAMWIYKTSTILMSATTAGFATTLRGATAAAVTLALTLKSLATVGVGALVIAFVLFYDYASKSFERLTDASNEMYNKLIERAEKYTEHLTRLGQKELAIIQENVKNQFQAYLIYYSEIVKANSISLKKVTKQYEISQKSVMEGWKIVANSFKNDLKDIENSLKDNINKIKNMMGILKDIEKEREQKIAEGLLNEFGLEGQRALLDIINQIHKQANAALLAGDEKTAQERYKVAVDLSNRLRDKVKESIELAEGDVTTTLEDLENLWNMQEQHLKQMNRQQREFEANLKGQIDKHNEIVDQQKQSIELQKQQDRLQKEILSIIESNFEKLKDIKIEDLGADKKRAALIKEIQLDLATLGGVEAKRLSERLANEQKIFVEMEKQRAKAEELKKEQQALFDIQERLLKIQADAAGAADEQNQSVKETGEAYLEHLKLLQPLMQEQIELLKIKYMLARPGASADIAADIRKWNKVLEAAQKASDAFAGKGTVDNLKALEAAITAIEAANLKATKDQNAAIHEAIMNRKEAEEALSAAQKKVSETQAAQVEAQQKLTEIRKKVATIGGEWQKVATNAQQAADQINSLSNVIDAMLIRLLNRLKEAPNLEGKRFARGGPVGTDTIPAWLSPGEYVWDAATVKRWYPMISAMHKAPRYMATGGSVTNVGDINVSVNGGGNAIVTARSIATQLKREIRRGALSLN